jgi:hypothetical protein
MDNPLVNSHDDRKSKLLDLARQERAYGFKEKVTDWNGASQFMQSTAMMLRSVRADHANSRFACSNVSKLPMSSHWPLIWWA